MANERDGSDGSLPTTTVTVIGHQLCLYRSVVASAMDARKVVMLLISHSKARVAGAVAAVNKARRLHGEDASDIFAAQDFLFAAQEIHRAITMLDHTHAVVDGAVRQEVFIPIMMYTFFTRGHFALFREEGRIQHRDPEGH